jgi:ubiquinone/menaquinone biosynthesis C-methylase UbiE
MGELVSIVTKNHLSTNRDYLGRVNDPEFPKWKAAELAKKYDFDYWDGDRRINYGGYRYKPGYWNPVAKDLITRYKLTSKSKVLDIGCGKGFLLFEISELLPGIEIYGLDISSYAIENAHPEVKNFVAVGTATELNYSNDYFDLAFSINTLHNLYNYELEKALLEMQRVAKKKFLCVESYRTELEKSNLIYWQVTCEAFNTPREWNWWFEKTNFEGDYEFIYFQ